MSDLHTKLSAAEQELTAQVKLLTKLRGALHQAEKDLAADKRPLQTLRKLAAELKETPDFQHKFSGAEITALIEQQIGVLVGTQERTLIADTRSAADAAGLPFVKRGDDLTLGPFLLKLVPAHDAAKLEFSKIEVTGDIPFDADLIVAKAQELSSGLLAPPKKNDLIDIAEELEEAIRVTIARKRNPSFVGDLRGELPAVYREMNWIRSGARKGREKAEVYPPARFVVEVKSLISSEFNLERARRFKLETAVIENAGNSKKSIFFPANLQQGWGEGTFFQAIVLLANT